METITSAATKFNGQVYTGRRHHLIRKEIIEETGAKHVPGGNNEGFWTSENRFVSRKEGAKIALASGQIKELKYQPNHLFSEDLW